MRSSCHLVLIVIILQLSKLWGRFSHTIKQRQIARLHTAAVNDLFEDIKSFKPSKLKQILEKANIDVIGAYDRSDLLERIRISENDWCDQQSCSIPLPAHEVEMKVINYVGIDVEIKNQNFQFVIDTGSSINLIHPDGGRNIASSPKKGPLYTQGMSGGGTVASSMATIDHVNVGGHVASMEVAVLKNSNSLPPAAMGLLGLAFLSSISRFVSFDFKRSSFQFGPQDALLSPIQWVMLKKLHLRRIFAGLLVCDVFLVMRSGNGPVKCTALIDLGATYTIINSAAITAAGLSLNELDDSDVQVVGIEGKPMKLKTLHVDSFSMGNVDDSEHESINMHAADIAGLAQIGLGSTPAMILGLDVLGRGRLILDLVDDVMYLKDP